MKKKINILGTSYTVITGVSVDKDEGLLNVFGYCSPTKRKIVIADLDSIESWSGESDDSKMRKCRETLRHEIIHAFLAESGLWGCSFSSERWALNEEMIDWFAIQSPKILRVFDQLNCRE